MTPEEREAQRKKAEKETKARLKATGNEDRPIYSDATVEDILDEPSPAPAPTTTGAPGVPTGSPTGSPTPSGMTPSMVEAAEEKYLMGAEGPKFAMPNPATLEEEPREGFLGGVMDIADRVWYDHMGDLLRGDAGFTQHIPGYEYTAGAVADVVLSGGSNLVETLYWGSTQSDRGLAWLYSALPGGMATLDAEWGGFRPVDEGGGFTGEVSKISAGRAGYAALAIPFAEFLSDEDQVKAAGGFAAALSPVLGPPALLLGGVALFDPDNPIFTKEGQENILDPSVQKEIFDDNFALGVLGAGSADFVWDIFGDPTIVGGKASSVIRYGTKAGRFSGYSNQSLRTNKQIEKFGQRVDEGLTANANGSSKTTAEFEHVKSLVDNEPDSLTNHVFVTNSNDPAAVMRLASQVDPGDYATGAALVKAFAGDASGWVQLSKTNPVLYDDLYRTVTGGADLFDEAARGAALTDAQISNGRKMMSEAQDALENARILEEGAENAYVAGQLLNRGGGRVASMAKGADAWRLGKARGRWGSPIIQESDQLGWATKTIQATSGSRPMMFIRWGGRGRPNNIVHLKGGDGVNANTEVHAWLTHSSIDPLDRAKFFDDYIKETTVEGRRNLLLAMERAEVSAVAKKVGLDDEAAMVAYQSYHSMRNRKVWEVRKTSQEMAEKKQGSAFTVDEQGNMVHVAGLYSELDEAFPLLDTLEFTRVVKANKGMLTSRVKNYATARGTEIGDVLNNMWKVSVLLRLGYTARNITEGALRSAATVGTMAAHPAALLRVPSSLRYRAAMKMAHSKNGKLTVKAHAVDDAMAQMNDAAKAIDDFKIANKFDAKASAEARLADLEELLKIQKYQSSQAGKLVSRDEFAKGRLPIDDEIDDISRGLDDLKKQFEVAEIKAAGGGGKSQMHDVQKKINTESKKLETRIERRKKAVDEAYAKLQAKAKKESDDAAKALAKRQEAYDKQRALLDEKQANYEANLPGLVEKNQLLNAKRANVEKRLTELRQVKARLDAKRPGRARIGESSNKVGVTATGDDIMYEGAFQGADGDIARILASADSTYSQVFNTGYQTRAKSLKQAKEWKRVDPSEIRTAAGWTEYWDDFSLKLNRTYRNDPILSRWLSRGDDDAGIIIDTEKWMMRADNKALVGTLRTQNGDRLVDASGNVLKDRVKIYVDETFKRYQREVPKGTGLRQALDEGQVTPEQVRVLFGANKPPVLTAPVELGEAGFTKAFDAYQSATGWAMKWLGTIPENNLLRHPFYESVFRAEQMRLARLAADNGADLLSKATKAQINGAARKVALKETRKTMYTIERQSNASNALRFMMPFFPAWENALRTWGRIAYRNPAVVGAGALAWNIPNSLGWVVDEKGNKVEYSNFLSETQETYIVYPPQVANALAKLNKDIGPFNTTMLMPFVGNFIPPADENGNALTTRTRQQGLNVVFPGGLLDPGVGPMSTIPTSLFLRGKPELTEVLRENMGDDMFGNFVPMGNPNTPIPDQFMPTIAKRTKQYLFGDEDENTAYLRLKNTMITDEIVRANLQGRKITTKDMERVLKSADKFWRWSVQQAAMGFTASVQYQSEFSVEQGMWRSLMDRTDLTYQEKLDAFIAKTGGVQYLPLTRSTSKNDFKLRYSQHSYERATKDKGRTEDISATFGPEYVGQFANIGDIADPFSYSVYGEYAGMRIDDERVLEKLTPEEIVEANDTAEYWRKRALAKDELDEQAIAMGLPGADSLDGYGDIMDVIEADLLEQHPGAQSALDQGFDTQRINKRIKVAQMTVDTAREYGDEDNPTVSVLAEYLAMRSDFVKALELTDDDDARKEIRKVAMAEVAALRAKDIGFADYFDRYLEDDDFRKVN